MRRNNCEGVITDYFVSTPYRDSMALASSTFNVEDKQMYLFGENEEEEEDVVLKVQQVFEKKVVTEEGMVYALKRPHEDYRLWLNAIKNNIPVLYFWKLGLDGKMYTIEGILFDGKGPAVNIKSGIAYQNMDTNILTLTDGRKVFVDWLCTSISQKTAVLHHNRKHAREYLGVKCKPEILWYNWDCIIL